MKIQNESDGYHLFFLDEKFNFKDFQQALHNHGSQIHEIVFSCISISNRSANKILQCISHSPSLKKFTASGVEISEKGFKTLAKIIEKNPQLALIDLSYSKIRDTWVETLEISLTSNSALKRLVLSNNGICVRGLNVLLKTLEKKPIEHLDISENFLLGGGLLISEIIEKNKTIAELILYNTLLDQNDIKKIIVSIQNSKSLKTLDLRQNHICDMIAHLLLSAAMNSQTLEILCLEYNNITDISLPTIYSLIQKSNTIKKLSLLNNQLHQLDERKIVASLENNYVFEELFLLPAYKEKQITEYLKRNCDLKPLLGRLKSCEQALKKIQNTQHSETFLLSLETLENDYLQIFKNNPQAIFEDQFYYLFGLFFLTMEDYHHACFYFNKSQDKNALLELYHLTMMTRELNITPLLNKSFARLLLLFMSQYKMSQETRLVLAIKMLQENKFPEKLLQKDVSLFKLIGVEKVVSLEEIKSILEKIFEDTFEKTCQRFFTKDAQSFFNFCHAEEISPHLKRHFGTDNLTTFVHILLHQNPSQFILQPSPTRKLTSLEPAGTLILNEELTALTLERKTQVHMITYAYTQSNLLALEWTKRNPRVENQNHLNCSVQLD